MSAAQPSQVSASILHISIMILVIPHEDACLAVKTSHMVKGYTYLSSNGLSCHMQARVMGMRMEVQLSMTAGV